MMIPCPTKIILSLFIFFYQIRSKMMKKRKNMVKKKAIWPEFIINYVIIIAILILSLLFSLVIMSFLSLSRCICACMSVFVQLKLNLLLSFRLNYSFFPILLLLLFLIPFFTSQDLAFLPKNTDDKLSLLISISIISSLYFSCIPSSSSSFPRNVSPDKPHKLKPASPHLLFNIIFFLLLFPFQPIFTLVQYHLMLVY